MNIFQIFRIIFPILVVIVILIILWKNISTHKNQSRGILWIDFILAMIFIAFGFAVYSIAPFLKEGEEFLADFSLGGSLFFAMVGIFFYTEYWHNLYRKISWFSKIFYIFVGATFILFVYHPWEITYAENYGYTQNISDIHLITYLILTICVVVILTQSITSIKKRIDRGTLLIHNMLRNESTTAQEKNLLLKREMNLLGKKKRLNFIMVSFVIGFVIAIIGLLPNTIILDSLGTLIAFLPQAYFLSKDEELLAYFLSQRVEEDAKALEKNISLLRQTSSDSFGTQTIEIKSLMDFIEKADTVFYKKT